MQLIWQILIIHSFQIWQIRDTYHNSFYPTYITRYTRSQYLVAWSKKLFVHVLFHIDGWVLYGNNCNCSRHKWHTFNAYRICPTTKLKSLPSIATFCKFGYYSHLNDLIKKQPTNWLYTAVNACYSLRNTPVTLSILLTCNSS